MPLRVVAVTGDDALQHRLVDHGLWPGVRVELITTALGGDPMLFRLHGYRLALRRDEAARVLVGPDVATATATATGTAAAAATATATAADCEGIPTEPQPGGDSAQPCGDSAQPCGAGPGSAAPGPAGGAPSAATTRTRA